MRRASCQREIRNRIHGERRALPGHRATGPGRGDHGGIVGAELPRGHVELPAALATFTLERIPKGAVGGDAAGEEDAPRPGAERRRRRLAHEHLHHRGLERGGDVGHLRLAERAPALQLERHPGLGSAEREIPRGGAPPRGPCRFTWSDTWVLIPLNEKSGAPSLIRAWEKEMPLGSPPRATRSMMGPPG